MKTVSLALAALFVAAPVFAQSMSDMKGMDHSMHGAAAADVAVADGTINGMVVDGGRAVVNVTHGPIPAFNWPPMRMDLKVADPKLLADLKPGDKVKFQLKKVSATDYVIVGFMPAAMDHSMH